MLRSTVTRLGLVTAAFVAGTLPAFAVGPASPDLSSLTPDFTTVTTAILAVAGAVIGVYVAWKGAKIVIRAVKGA